MVHDTCAMAPRAQGALLAWLVETLRVARAVEVGVFTGYSALATALACALPGPAGPVPWRFPLLGPMWPLCKSSYSPRQMLHKARQNLHTCEGQNGVMHTLHFSDAVCSQALPEDGRLVACDRDASSLAIARQAWDAAGVGHKARSCTIKSDSATKHDHGGHGAEE